MYVYAPLPVTACIRTGHLWKSWSGSRENPAIPESNDENRFGSEVSSALKVAQFCYYYYINETGIRSGVICICHLVLEPINVPAAKNC